MFTIFYLRGCLLVLHPHKFVCGQPALQGCLSDTCKKRIATNKQYLLTKHAIVVAKSCTRLYFYCTTDESKLSYRDLQEEFVLLQSERQELLERVFSLESQLCDQQKLVSEQV